MVPISQHKRYRKVNICKELNTMSNNLVPEFLPLHLFKLQTTESVLSGGAAGAGPDLCHG